MTEKPRNINCVQNKTFDKQQIPKKKKKNYASVNIYMVSGANVRNFYI